MKYFVQVEVLLLTGISHHGKEFVKIDRKFNDIYVKKRQQKNRSFTLDNAFPIPYTLTRKKKRE